MYKSALILIMFLSGCAQMGEMLKNAGQPTAKTVSATEQSIDQAQLEAYNGPKARVAVSRFTDQSAKGKGIAVGYPGFAWYSPQIGNGMADMLSDALLQSNRFIVLDRQAIQDVLQEQDLAAGGRINHETGAPVGQVEGADLLIKGSVTEFEPGSAGANAGAILGGFGWTGAVIGGLVGGLRQSHVAIIIQVVDAKTSRILFSTTVEGKANDFDIGGALGGFGGGFLGGAGLGTWQKTPVEKAIRIAVQQAVRELASKTPPAYFRHGAEDRATSPKGSNNQSLISAAHQIRNETVSGSANGAISSVLPSTLRVKPNTANLRDVPGTQGKVLATLKAGTKLSVQGEEKGWYFVQAENGKDGWISKSLTREAIGSEY
jgi:curli biogenesis system outer membrane secretion channel CsgG